MLDLECVDQGPLSAGRTWAERMTNSSGTVLYNIRWQLPAEEIGGSLKNPFPAFIAEEAV